PLRESLALCIEAVDGRGTAIAAAALAGLLAEQGSIEAAARLHALAERTARRDRLPDWPPPDEIGYTEGVETLSMEMGGGGREALEEGEGMTWEAALDLVDVSLSASAVSGTLEKPGHRRREWRQADEVVHPGPTGSCPHRRGRRLPR